jgi:hypothetical protein
MVADGINGCVDPRQSPLSCGNDHAELLMIQLSCATILSVASLLAVLGFTLRRWVAHGTSIRTLPGMLHS